MSELINKLDATTIPVMPKEYRKYQTMNLDDAYEQGWNDLQRCIEKFPSAKSGPEWIPVSERLPEEKKDVLIAFKHNMAVGFWEDILDNGEPAWYANSGDGWMTGTTTVDSDGIPIAWMPLPEPYKAGEKDE